MLQIKWVLLVLILMASGVACDKKAAIPDRESNVAAAREPAMIPANTGEAGFFIFIDNGTIDVWDGGWTWVGDVSGGLAMVRDENGYTYIRQDRTSFGKRYARALPFRGEYAAVQDMQSGLWGVIDQNGRDVIAPKWEGMAWIESLHPHIYAEKPALIGVRSGGKWGFIDYEGNVVIDFQYEMAYPFQNGIARVSLSPGSVQFIGIDGKFAFLEGSPFHGKALAHASSFVEDMAVYEDGSRKLFGVVNVDGREIVPPQWKAISPFSQGIAIVRDSSHELGMIDHSGEILSIAKYKSIRPCRDGMAAVQDGRGKWGYVDRRGKEVLPLVYDKAGDFHSGYAYVEKEDVRGVVDKQGKWLGFP